jgi:uncharacterized protein YndB with AHSA1/START domain
MKDLKQNYSINAPLDLVWRAFVDPKVIEQWGGGPAQAGVHRRTGQSAE